MSTEIVVAIVSLVGAAVTGIVLLIIDKLFFSPRRTKLRESILEYVYTPFIKAIEDGDVTNIDFHNLLNRIRDDHFNYIPSQLSDMIKSLPYDEKPIDLSSTLVSHINTNYNWLRKKLGFQYSKNEIIKKQLLNYGKKQSFVFMLDIIITATSFFTAFMLMSNYRMKETSNSILILIFFCAGWALSRVYSVFINAKWDV